MFEPRGEGLRPALGKSRFILAWTILLIVSGAVYFAPRLGNYLNDAAPSPHDHSRGLFLNSTDKHLFDKSVRGSVRTATERAGVEFAVIIEPSPPENRDIVQHAAELFSRHRIGKDHKGRGILLYFSEQTKHLKIEVSYDLEHVFTDAKCSRLERGARTFMLAQNRRDFLVELLVTMGIHYVRYKEKGIVGELDFPFLPEHQRLTRQLSGGAGVVGRGYSAALEQIQFEVRKTPAAFNAYLPSHDPEESVRRYLHSLSEGIGDPNFPLLTPGSRYYRVELPRNRGYLRRTFDYYQSAMPFRVYVKDHLALAVFKFGEPVWPVVLRKSRSGAWLVDEAQSWANFHAFEDSKDFTPKYANNPYRFAYKMANHPMKNVSLYKERALALSPMRFPSDLQVRIKELEAKIKQHPNDPAAYFELGDVLYFECYWLSAAEPLFRKGLDLDPKNKKYRWRLVDVVMNGPRVEPLIETLETVLKYWPSDQYAKNWHNHLVSYYGD